MFNLQPFILICKLILTTLTLYNHHLYMTIVHACVGSSQDLCSLTLNWQQVANRHPESSRLVLQTKRRLRTKVELKKNKPKCRKSSSDGILKGI